ncbi:hypothetical protein M513_06608 [Trichuris suis]|uniref:AMOP domain protein n=1 Tax=Trichuris suis TaxID=68888 RepID=A0A085M5S8_9BILA|nr:hypothetical protein M513_06608 [Trichuris suis]
MLPRWLWVTILVGWATCQIPNPFSGTLTPIQSSHYGNLYQYGKGTTDEKLYDRELTTGRQIDLFTFFPYYGGRYNYTVRFAFCPSFLQLSVHGYAAFGNVLDLGTDFAFGEGTENWPDDPDPALIAVYACRQRPMSINPDHQGIHYRLVFRSNMISDDGESMALVGPPMKRSNLPTYVDHNGDAFLDKIQEDLRDGIVGANSFQADVALVVTWENVTFMQASNDDEDKGRTATYQLVLTTDRAGQLSYAIINYHKLGYAGSDIMGSARRGRCKAELNGGNATGSVLVDPVYSKMPMQLAMMSSVPHRVRGRYLFRVDDIVRKGGCSNLTVGTYRLNIYPDIVNSMGDTTVQVNGPCMSLTDTPVLYVAENKPAYCKVKNAAIAECKMVRYYHWGVKYVYFSVRNIKSYVGSIYYVPSGLDPYALTMGQIDHWFQKEPPGNLKIMWYADNFTGADFRRSSQLQLTLWGYKERRDDRETKFIPTLELLGKVGSNIRNPMEKYRNIGEYVLSNDVKLEDTPYSYNELQTFRFGFLKLADMNGLEEGNALWSPPIPIHRFFIKRKEMLEMYAADECIRWFEEDGQQWNFIRDTETNASCPCRYEQAIIDIGRFMPHPRCSQRFRSLHCDTYVGAKECFLNAHNVQGNYVTHYGQVCCYDRDGYLMHTSYQTVVQIENYPYNPGFPQRAFEFGTYPFAKQFELPTMSHYYHDVLPYYLCCKWAPEHCQFFYWRRPSSSCLEYRPPAFASVFGAGHFMTFDGRNYSINKPGTYMLVHKPKTEPQWRNNIYQAMLPEVQIQIRMESYPDRTVDFGHRDTYQHRLVQPLNVSVVTGVAVQEGTSMESDRVLVLLRKDTRRYKYRTHILVNDELRYFDTIKTQRFRGVTVYVNDWKEGQCEVFVVLEQSRIGLRIQESYSIEITRHLNYEESLGLLNVLVSVPPEYRMEHYAGQRVEYSDALTGLAGTFSSKQPADLVHSDRKTIAQYANEMFVDSWKVDNHQFHSLFSLLTTDHRDWPEAHLIGPVYPVAKRWMKENYRENFVPSPILPAEFHNEYHKCMNSYDYHATCPSYDTMKAIEKTCLEMYHCQYDSFYLKQPYLGYLLKQEEVLQLEIRTAGMHNSCGAINVEYPDFLLINPATGKLYLEGNEVLFECYPSHWLKGDSKFTCTRGRWNQGWQPWCRSKQLETTLRILSIIFGLLVCIAFIGAIFVCCWAINSGKKEPPPPSTYRAGVPLLGKPDDTRGVIPFSQRPRPNATLEPPPFYDTPQGANAHPVNQVFRRPQDLYGSTANGSTSSSHNSPRRISPVVGMKTLV